VDLRPGKDLGNRTVLFGFLGIGVEGKKGPGISKIEDF
jgi:hypothetical protein